MLADTPFGVTTVPGVAAPRAVVIETLGAETVIPELIDVAPTAVVALTPLTETITDPDTPCEAKAASAKLEAAKVIYSLSISALTAVQVKELEDTQFIELNNASSILLSSLQVKVYCELGCNFSILTVILSKSVTMLLSP